MLDVEGYISVSIAILRFSHNSPVYVPLYDDNRPACHESSFPVCVPRATFCRQFSSRRSSFSPGELISRGYLDVDAIRPPVLAKKIEALIIDTLSHPIRWTYCFAENYTSDLFRRRFAELLHSYLRMIGGLF